MTLNLLTKNFIIAVMLLLVTNSYSQYGAMSFNKAVNISGKQRMLSQRMAKIYLYLIDNPNDIKAKKDLKISKIIFEKQLNILKKNTQNTWTLQNIEEVNTAWEKYKEILESTPNNKSAIKIINTNSTVLKYANNVVNSIIDESKGSIQSNEAYIEEEDSELKSIINKSGKQRMLAQRLALYYYANKPNLKTKGTTNRLETVFTELDGVIDELLISSFNNDRIDDSLGNVMELWQDVKDSKEKLLKQGYDDLEMYSLSNKLTKNFNSITNLYEKVRIE